jgi:secreted trypsin-like serine protease
MLRHLVGKSIDIFEQGDSGSPLVDEAAVQHGITSIAFSGCEAGFPAAYTQVSYYIDWIKENAAKILKKKSLE